MPGLLDTQPTGGLLSPSHEVKPRSYFGYQVRPTLYPGEDSYFKKNPHVSGMAAGDGKIIFNPYSSGVNLDSVGVNEAARLWMRDANLKLDFDVTEEQRKQFEGTSYEFDEDAMKQTLVGRIIGNDPSAGNVTPEQKEFAEFVLNKMKNK